MSNLSQSTLAQIVTNDYRAAAIFEKYQLDYCCRGKRSIVHACEERGIEPTEVLNELQSIVPHNSENRQQHAWQFENGIALGKLADHIEQTHHSYVKNEIPIIIGFLQKIALKHGSRHPELITIQNHFIKLSEELLKHLQKEENILFPAIRKLESRVGDVIDLSVEEKKELSAAIWALEMEHEGAGDEMLTIRILSNAYTTPADACTAYKIAFRSLYDFEKDLHRHVHLENNVLFPAISEIVNQ